MFKTEGYELQLERLRAAHECVALLDAAQAAGAMVRASVLDDRGEDAGTAPRRRVSHRHARPGR